MSDLDYQWLTVQEVARMVKVSDRTVRRRIDDGALIAKRIGPKLWRVRRDSVANLLEAA